MGLIDAQLDGVAAGNRAALARVYDIARKVDPTATEGESYGMAALLHRGKGYVAALEAKAHLGLYPFSGSVFASIADELTDFDWSPGALKFSADHEIPEPLLRRILEVRIAQIDAQLDRSGRRR
ncbi:iron chaperone [Agromyces sp. Marseille-Q5079]|uniref:iron chaperone n=1 Tax=Agromyces sp. Marseille-Q5079 TaxID=3439059 RepID=UPI003D9C92DC